MAALGLQTVGTVQQRAERLFLMKHTLLEKLYKKHFTKGTRGAEQNGAVATGQDLESLKDVALMETKMKKLCELLSKTNKAKKL